MAPSSAADPGGASLPALHPPRSLRDIAAALDAAGYDVWAVGGAVRDAVRGERGDDWDLATNARPAQVRKLFRRTVPIGIEHGTVGVLGRDRRLYEVTTFRRDVETTGRRAVVAFADSVEEDLARRDFTINAIAWHPVRNELRDPYGGMGDLTRGVLRTVGAPAERFAEDYLRVLRALRFAGQFGLEIEPPTWDALCAAVPSLGILSAERVREELWKVLGRTHAASRTLRLYAASGTLAKLFPELAALPGVEFDGVDAWERTLAAVDAVPRHRVLLRVTALLHATGVPAARTRDLRGGWRITGHERWAARRAEDTMRRLKSSNADRERVVGLVERQADLFPPDAPAAGVRRWLLHVPPPLVRDFFRLRIALYRAAPTPGGGADLVARWRKAHAELLRHPVLSVRELAIGGHELQALGVPAGPDIGRILEDLLRLVLDDPALNERDTLIALVREREAL